MQKLDVVAHVGVERDPGRREVDDLVGIPRDAERRVRRRRPVDVKVPQRQPVDRTSSRTRRRPSRRTRSARRAAGSDGPVEIRGMRAAEVRVHAEQVEVDRPRRKPLEHLVPLERHHALPRPRSRVDADELIDPEVVPVRPHAELRVVVQHRGRKEEIVAIPRAGRIGGLRYRDALVVLAGLRWGR